MNPHFLKLPFYNVWRTWKSIGPCCTPYSPEPWRTVTSLTNDVLPPLRHGSCATTSYIVLLVVYFYISIDISFFPLLLYINVLYSSWSSILDSLFQKERNQMSYKGFHFKYRGQLIQVDHFDDHCLSVELVVNWLWGILLLGLNPFQVFFWKPPVEPDLS